MHKNYQDQASGLRLLMGTQDTAHESQRTKLMELLAEESAQPYSIVFQKIQALDIPLINFTLEESYTAPLAILNENTIVFYINRSSNSIKAAYQTLKLLNQSVDEREIGFIISTDCESKALNIFHNIKKVTQSLYQIHLVYLGCLIQGNTYISAHNSDI